LQGDGWVRLKKKRAPLVKPLNAMYKPGKFPKSACVRFGPWVDRWTCLKIELEFVMAVPKRKTTPSKRGMRRSADALKAPTYVEDKNSGELRRPHHIDLKTGMYRGRQVLTPKESA